MKKIKKILMSVILSAMLLLMGVLPVYADQEGPDVFAEGYCVMNMATGEIIFQKNMDERFYPASTTKIMTALVTLENCEDLDDQLTFSDYAVNSLSADSSTMKPKGQVGETMRVRDALYGLLLSSANECGNALAEYTAGSVDQFAQMMNERAAQVGAVNTHFVNPHGLHDENHYTTPHDLALIFREAMKNQSFAEIDSTIHYQIPATNLVEARDCEMTHSLVNGTIPFEGVYAGKTGQTPEAGRALVTVARRYGVDIITVIMHSDNSHFYQDTEVLLEYGFGAVSGSYPNLVFTPMDDTVYASVEDLHVREFASTYAQIMGVANSGVAMHRTGTFAGWSKVEVDGGSYYVSTDYLVDAAGAAVAAPYATLEPTTASAPESSTQPPASEEQTPEPATVSGEEASEELQPADGTVAPSGEQRERPSSPHVYEINEDMLVGIILVLVFLIAIVIGVIVAILIMRRAK